MILFHCNLLKRSRSGHLKVKAHIKAKVISRNKIKIKFLSILNVFFLLSMCSANGMPSMERHSCSFLVMFLPGYNFKAVLRYESE